MRRLAYEEFLIAEGSDWCWWYGPEHGSDNRPEFDQLYRDHLSNVYRALGKTPPAALSQPILKSQPGELHEPPLNAIHATLDGEITSIYEWSGAGRFRPDQRSASMHSEPVFREFYYGVGGDDLFVRLDGVRSEGSPVFTVEFESGVAETRSTIGPVTELTVRKSGSRFRIRISRDGLPAEIVPANSWIELN